MQTKQISVGVIGLGISGKTAAKCLQGIDNIELVGIVDHNAQLATEVGNQLGLPTFTDTRQMILNAKPDAVFISVPPTQLTDILVFCLKQKINVWVEAPFGRNLGEAAAFVRGFADAGLKLAVGTQRRFVSTYQKVNQLSRSLGQIFSSSARYSFNWGPNLGWRSDKNSAGGGALLELGYHPIDLLTWTMGLPEDVYGVTTIQQPELANAQNPNHNTDDTAVAILRYQDDAVASINTSRVSGPVSEELILQGANGSILANAEFCTLRNPQGDIVEHFEEDLPPLEVFKLQAEAFISAVRSDAKYYMCSAAENLLNLAIIDAIYLSTQTLQPESPARQLHIHGVKLSDCLQYIKPVSDEE